MTTRAVLAALLVLGAPAPRQDASPADRLLDAVERRHRAVPDPADPRVAAARLGFDRARILEFVAGLAWEPYEGVLRDAAGTLLCGGGNSLDRALLLQSMLETGGEKTRLMRGDLAPEDGARLLESFRKRERKERPESDPAALARELGVDPAALGALVAERRREEASLVDEVLEAAKDEAGRIGLLVADVQGRTAALPREHFWVQAWDGAKKDWVDFDASPVEIPRRGGRVLAPAELSARRRTATFRLVLHRKSGGKTEPVPLLQVPLDLASVSWKAVDLLIQPERGQLPPAPKLREMEALARLEAFRAVKQYRPGLIVDGRSYGGLPFDLQGRTYDVDPGGRMGGPKALAGGLGRALGAFGGGGEAPAASQLESVVFELAVREPGSPERVHRRTLVAPTPAAPRPLPILRTTFLVEGGLLPAGERGRRELASIARNAPALRRLLRGQVEGVHFNQHAEVSSLLLRYADFRRRLIGRVAEGPAFFQERAGLVAETSQIFLDEEGARVLHRRGIDILENPGLFHGAGDATLRLGVAETLLECLLVERGSPGEARQSAWTFLQRARLAGGRPETSDRAGRRELRWSPEAAWVVDPATGICVGRVPSGAGQAMLEAAWENANAVCTYADVVGIASALTSAAKVNPPWAEEAAGLFGKACGVVGGTWPRDMMMDKINEIQKGLWDGAISALSGM
jgi:hypothetical protein